MLLQFLCEQQRKRKDGILTQDRNLTWKRPFKHMYCPAEIYSGYLDILIKLFSPYLFMTLCHRKYNIINQRGNTWLKLKKIKSYCNATFITNGIHTCCLMQNWGQRYALSYEYSKWLIIRNFPCFGSVHFTSCLY